MPSVYAARVGDSSEMWSETPTDHEGTVRAHRGGWHGAVEHTIGNGADGI